ncbi:hypothetical protein EV182_000646 [Spiromyces aspiralis]|uniref:Uncharacterized protein n=1 Tax=Spiromyces aspiralis TaxID=68401 RepID=A0ACC1HKT2_9FUNG|nr:hypothetical protein EV182_000646 [Spiromyces aspiralis]
MTAESLLPVQCDKFQAATQSLDVSGGAQLVRRAMDDAARAAEVRAARVDETQRALSELSRRLRRAREQVDRAKDQGGRVPHIQRMADLDRQRSEATEGLREQIESTRAELRQLPENATEGIDVDQAALQLNIYRSLGFIPVTDASPEGGHRIGRLVVSSPASHRVEIVDVDAGDEVALANRLWDLAS